MLHFFRRLVNLTIQVPFLFCILLTPVLVAAQPIVQVWWSSELLPEDSRWFTDPPPEEEITCRLSRQDNLLFTEHGRDDITSIVVDPSQIYQSVLGIGTSLEATTLYAIRKGRTEAQARDVLKALIDPKEGLGFNLFRITIGTSDFSDGRSVSDHPQGYYSYQDDPEAPFSIQNDIDTDIIETLKWAQDVAAGLDPPRDILFFASCWSPPGWMKTSGSLIGGTLKSGYEKHLARYFRSFIEAYEALGIPIYAMTIQNEPAFVPRNYPGMRLSPEQERDIVLTTFEEFHDNLDDKKEIETRLWIHDHNFDGWTRADQILSTLEETGKKHYVDASAFHNYVPSPASNMTILHEKHPGNDIVFTEHSEWGVAGMYNIQQYFWNWSRSYAYWVTMSTQKLDEHNQGPYNSLGALSPTLIINKDLQPPGWYPTPEYFLLGQFSKFVQAGAHVISSDRGSPSAVTVVSFLNPDHTIVTVVVNQTEQEQAFKLIFEGKETVSLLPAKTVGTYVWAADE